jgi:Zn-dependent protease
MEHDLVSGAMWYGAFLFSTVCHEASHAWAASRLGDETAEKGGQVTLNPAPHIRREPFGMVVVPILSWYLGGWIIGWASAPYGVAWARQYPRRAALMALAGPGTNLALALIAGLLIRVGYEWGVFGAPLTLTMSSLATGPGGGITALAAHLLSIFLSLNLLLCLFNMIPLPPLDGSNAPLLLLPAGGARRYSEALRNPLLRYAGILIAWRLIPSILPRLLLAVAGVLYSSIH